MDQELEIKPTHGVTGDLGRPACDVGRQEGGLTDPCWLLAERMPLGFGGASPSA